MTCSGIFFQGHPLKAQCTGEPVSLANPSFEGSPSKGVAPTGWTACQSGQSPDIQPGNFAVTLSPSNGFTYAGLYFIDTLIHPGIGSWQEGLSQPLSAPLVPGTAYQANIDLSNSSTTDSGLEPGCAELEIWGGYGECDHSQLLWHSGDITNYDSWLTYSISFIPSAGFTHISLQVKGLGCSGMPYILVDNLSDLVPQFQPEVMLTASDDTVCAGTPVTLTAVPVNTSLPCTFIWNVPGMVQSQLFVHPLHTETYTVIAVDSNGCASKPSSVKINVFQPLSFIYSMEEVCNGKTATLLLTGKGGDGRYSFNLQPLNLTGETIRFIPNADIIYTVTVQDGCSAYTDTIDVIIHPNPVANFSAQSPDQLTYYFNDLSSIDKGMITGWNWNFGDKHFSSDINPVHQFDLPANHQVTLEVISDKGCPGNPFVFNFHSESKNVQTSPSLLNRNSIIPRGSINQPDLAAERVLVFSTDGAKIAELNHPDSPVAVAISNLNLTSGIYIYKVITAGQESGGGKISVSR